MLMIQNVKTSIGLKKKNHLLLLLSNSKAECNHSSTVGGSLGRVLCAPFRKPRNECLCSSTDISLLRQERRVKCDAEINQQKLRPRPHVSGNFCITTTPCVHTYPVNSVSCGRSYPQIFEYAEVTLSDPVFPGCNEMNQHGVSQPTLYL